MKKQLLRKIPIQSADETIILSARQLQESNIEYIISGQIEKVSDENILLLTFFNKDNILKDSVTPEFRVFFAEYDYIAQKLDCEPMKWLTGSLDYILPYYSDGSYNGCWTQRSFVADDETLSSIEQFIGIGSEKPLAALNGYQDSVKSRRLEKKHQIIKERIDEKMQIIEELPDDFTDWIDNTGFGDKRYLFYKYANRKYKEGYCTICKSLVVVEKPRHNTYGTCPNCGGKIMFKSEGKSKNIWDSKYVSLFQKTPDGFVIRYFHTHRNYENFKKLKISLFESNRDFYENDNIDSYVFDNFKHTDDRRWCETNYVFGYKPTYIYYRYNEGWQSTVYEKNLSNVIADTKYRYSAIKEYATHCPGALMYVHNYLAAYEKYSYIEYITKLRLYKLVEDIIMYRYSPCANVNSIDDILGMGKQYLKIMQEIDGGYAELAIAQKLTHANIPFNAGYLCWVRDAFGYDAVTAIDYTTYASLERIHRYCSQYADRFNDFRHVFTLWKDYISSCEKLDYDLTNDFVLFPRDLKKSHDMAYKRVDTLRKKNGKKILNNMTKRLAGYLAELSEKYTFENDEYAVIVPSNLNDIVKEGHVLHHCVGTYAERVGGRETVILFIRLKSDIKTPFYTLEMQHNKIIQCRGKMNCKMTADIKSFVDLFEKRISLSADKQHATAG